MVSGKDIKIGEFKGKDVTINMDYIKVEKGNRKEFTMFDKALSYLFLILGIICFVLCINIVIQTKNIDVSNLISLNNDIGLTFVFSFIFILYSVYLGRDRHKFNDNWEISNLNKFKGEVLEIEDYMDNKFLSMLDEALDGDNDKFLYLIANYLFNNKDIESLYIRIGLTKDKVSKILSDIFKLKGQSVDNSIVPFLLGCLDIAYQCEKDKVDISCAFIHLCMNDFANILLRYDVELSNVEGLKLWIETNTLQEKYRKAFKFSSPLKPISTVNRSYTSAYTATLNKFSTDYTAEVAQGDFMMSIGREDEIDKLIEFVQQGKRSATLVIGAPGVGKTTFIKTFALRMVCEDVPDIIKDMRLVNFEFNRAFAYSKNIDDFKEKVEKVLEEVSKAKNIILLMEDFNQLVSIRNEYAGEVINLIVNAMENGNLRIIATTNPEGYNRDIRPNNELNKLFSIIEIKEPSDTVAQQILLDELPRLEKKYKLKIEFSALPTAVKLSHQYEFDRVLPDKAIQLIEEVCSNANMSNLKFVDKAQVENVVSKKVGVNVGKIGAAESKHLANLEDEIHKRIVGQDEAVKSVASAIRRSRAGLNKGNRPIASFLFFGPTGVGKTELAKAITATYYGDEKLMVRIDMSEYQEEENLTRLIGKVEGDDFIGGYLTDAIRSKPYSLILLDEVEKANPRVLDLFLQILDEGKVTDGLGRKISFTNTIIIMTSNAGSRQIAESINEGKKYLDIYRDVQTELKKVFRIEFLNRFDKVIMFKPLLRVELIQIAGLLLGKVKNVLKDRGIELRWEEPVLEEIVNVGYNKVYGARELRRVIQNSIEDKIAKSIIDGDIKSGSIVTLKSLNNFIIS